MSKLNGVVTSFGVKFLVEASYKPIKKGVVSIDRKHPEHTEIDIDKISVDNGDNLFWLLKDPVILDVKKQLAKKICL